MICDFCKNDFTEFIWEMGVTYKGIDEHHNPPKFLFKNEKDWKGEIYNLCRKHHRELHDEIIKILNIIAKPLKFVNSEHWIIQKMNEKQIKEAREVIYVFTKDLFIGGNNGTTKTITK